MTVLLAQQQAARRTQRAVASRWTPEAITRIGQFQRVESVTRNWPLVQAALREFGWDDPRVDAAAIGTIAIETASSFEPVMEAYYLFGTPFDYDRVATDEYLRTHDPSWNYYPYYGRGFVQTTWLSNYQRVRDVLGVNVIGNPSLLLDDPQLAARALALYFTERGVAEAALREDWASVRYLVLGGYDGLARLRNIAITLLEHL